MLLKNKNNVSSIIPDLFSSDANSKYLFCLEPMESKNINYKLGNENKYYKGVK